MMDEFKIIARLMAAIKAGEDMPVFNCSLVDEKVLQTTSAKRDRLAIMLRDEGYIDGLFVIDDIDNRTIPVILWNNSHPKITLKGLEYLNENSAVRKALLEIKNTGIAIASQVVSNVINGMM